VIRMTRSFAALALAVAVGACSDSAGPTSSDAMTLQLSIVGPQTVSQAETDALGSAFDRVDEYEIVIVDSTTAELITHDTLAIGPGLPVHALDVAVPDDAFGRTVTITLIAFDDDVELYRSTQTLVLSDDLGQISVVLAIRYTGPGIRGVITDAQGVALAASTVNLWQGQSILESVQTEADGSYLFLDVLAGSYLLEPIPGAGLAICPVSRPVTVVSPDDALERNFVAIAASCTTNVLVLSGGDFDDTGVVASALAADVDLNVSTFFFVNQLPGVGFLSQHDVVVVFMNGLFNESSSLGDELAAYVQGGGNIVTASFYYQGRSDSGVGSTGWGGLEAIDPFTPVIDPLTGVGGATYQTVSLNGNNIVAHPLTANLTALTSTSFSSGVQAKVGTEVVASWTDGAPLVGYRIGSAGQRLVAVSLFPVPDATITGDVDILWNNVVRWAGFTP